MKRVLVLLPALLIAVLVTTSTAEAALLQEGFETSTAAPNLSSGDYDPDSSVWKTSEDYTGNITVVSTTTVGGSPTWIHSGNNAVRFRSSQARELSASFEGSPKVVLEFWTYTPAINIGFRTLNFSLRDTIGATVGPNLAFYGNSIQYTDGSSWGEIANIITDRYVNVKLIADGDTQTFALEYDGVLYNNNGLGYDFYGNTGTLGKVYFSFSQDNREAYVDDISVYAVPEPATLAILSLGLLFARKKK